MRILVTRPREDGAPLAEKLAAAGHQVVTESLLQIRFIPGATVDLDNVQAILFTSANGVRAFAAAESRRDLPAFAVGESTAARARAAGFSSVESAGGNVEDLAKLVGARLQPTGGALLHAAGRDIAGDLAGTLEAAGFHVRRAVLYAAEPVARLSPGTEAALRAGDIDAVLFYSPRTAETFCRLVREADLAPAMSKTVAIGISGAALAPVKGLPWAAVEAAPQPTEADLLTVIERHAVPHFGRRTGSEPPPAAAHAPRAAALSRWSSRFVVPMTWLAVLLSLATFALQTTSQNRPAPEVGAAGALRLDTRLAALERQVTAMQRAEARPAPDPQIENRMKALEDKMAARSESPAVAGAAPDDARLTGLEQKVEALAASIDTLANSVAKRPDSGEIAALMADNRRLAAELARMQEQLAALDTAHEHGASQQGLLLAAGQLQLAAARGEPVAVPVATIRKLADNDPRLGAAISQLEALGDKPVPTIADLRDRFGALAAAAVRTAGDSGRAPIGDTLVARWWNGVVGRLSKVISIRRVGDVPGEGDEARIARAEQRLTAADLAAAVTDLEGLTGRPAEIFAGWLSDARARLALDRAVGDVVAVALAAPGPAVPGTGR